MDDWKRITVSDPEPVGRKVVEWTLYPETRPKTLEEMLAQFGGNMQIVDKSITKMQLVETPEDTVVIRLPSKKMTEEALKRFGDPAFDIGKYPLADYRKDRKTAIAIFHSSVGDYTTRECE